MQSVTDNARKQRPASPVVEILGAERSHVWPVRPRTPCESAADNLLHHLHVNAIARAEFQRQRRTERDLCLPSKRGDRIE
jgi:hypothetical protein